jgi:hypothetical protein
MINICIDRSIDKCHTLVSQQDIFSDLILWECGEGVGGILRDVTGEQESERIGWVLRGLYDLASKVT